VLQNHQHRNVGIGTATPANARDVNGSLAVGTYAGTASGASNELIVSGNVGIGTTSPSSTLDVRGQTVRQQAPDGTWGSVELFNFSSNFSVDNPYLVTHRGRGTAA
jgi:hypothetical protein